MTFLVLRRINRHRMYRDDVLCARYEWNKVSGKEKTSNLSYIIDKWYIIEIFFHVEIEISTFTRLALNSENISLC